MAKLYIFFNRRICGVDGSIQYIYNKERFLESKGYKVLVFSVCKGEIFVNSFRKFEKYILTGMRFCPSIYRESTIKSIIDEIIDRIDVESTKEIIIESTSPVSAAWAELVAKKLKCRHVYFHLMEKTNLPRNFVEFCRFKYNRDELAGITENTLSLLLKDDSVERRKIRAFCSNVIEECEDIFSKDMNKSAMLTIGSIGRLEKPYIHELIRRVGEYFKKNSSDSFNFILIGGDKKGKNARKIKKFFSSIKNVTLIITDYMYPIPKSLIENIDLFISASGSANSTYWCERPTIKINPISGKPLGIIGSDFKLSEKNIYDSSQTLTIESCINRIVRKDTIITYEKLDKTDFDDMMYNEFEKQLAMVIENNNDLDFYDEKLIKKLKTPFKKNHYMYSIMGHIFGENGLYKLIRLMSRSEAN